MTPRRDAMTPTKRSAPPPKSAATSREWSREPRWPKRLLRGLLRLPVVLQAASLVTATRFVLEGASMEPDLAHGQYLLVNRLAYLFDAPRRGDLIVLRDPTQPAVNCIKRAIGLPEEHVQMQKGDVLVDGHPLDEPYIEEHRLSHTPFPNQWLLDVDEYFVLGDHRQDSRDSRSFGPIRRGHIIGKAWFRYWPPGTWRLLG